MRALVITQHGSPEVLKVLDRPEPQAGPGEVRVAVKAAGLIFSDLLARVGMYPDAPKPPSVIGYEVAGDVESVGDGVENLKPGDRVIAGTRFGGQAELAVAKAADVFRCPTGGVTRRARRSRSSTSPRTPDDPLRQRVRGRARADPGRGRRGRHCRHPDRQAPGRRALRHRLGVERDAIRGFGIEHAIDYHSQDPVKEIRRIAGEKRPLDLVMDAVGGNSFRKSWSLLRAGGRLVAFGVSESGGGERRQIGKALKMLASSPIFPVLTMMRDSKSVIGLNMLTLQDAKGLQDYIQPLTELMEQGVADPVVDKAFPIDQAADAHRYLSERKNIGKVVLTF